MKIELSTPIKEIPKIGPIYQKRLKKLGIKTVRDLLYHFPHRYEDFSNLKKIAQVKVGEKVSLQGKILEITNTQTWKKKMILTQAIVADNSGSIKIVWFNQPYLVNVLKKGNFISLSGKVTFDEYGLYLSNPAYEKISHSELDTSNLIHTGRLVAIYPETERLSSRWLRKIIQKILIKIENKLRDFIPGEIIKKFNLFPLKEALWQVHFPDSLNSAQKAKERFSFEELFLLQLYILRERLALKRERAVSIPLNLELVKNFINSLPFELTLAQKRSLFQILKDLEKPRPMNRLLEGDVGSGKTIVALIAALNVARAGYQIALMAPTEILARQHFKTSSYFLRNFQVKIGLLTREESLVFGEQKISQISRKKFLQKIKNGEIDFLIGTHALIQKEVEFKNLALVILDEQHRFGVEQRARLVKRQEQPFLPHLLSMTATPIPRTLALALYGDLDLSLLDQLPKGRKKVVTKIIPPEKRKLAYDFIREQVKAKNQVFVICPRIEKRENENLNLSEVKAVKEEYEKLSKVIFPDLKVAMLHGRMKAKEKEKIMKDFKEKKIDILVSTSVVEVGIDIPNATIIMIEGAERFGLAQLHQFRGRVGRGEKQSFCFLFTESSSKKTRQRLEALLTCENGFELAEKDLEMRGPGEIFGAKQWGLPDIAMESLKDVSLVEKARNSAKEILEKDPELKKYPLLRKKLAEFKKRVHLE